MGSYSESVNLLGYLRSKSQVDCDSLDIERKFVPWLGPLPIRRLRADIT